MILLVGPGYTLGVVAQGSFPREAAVVESTLIDRVMSRHSTLSEISASFVLSPSRKFKNGNRLASSLGTSASVACYF